jgi:hypothetical protein
MHISFLFFKLKKNKKVNNFLVITSTLKNFQQYWRKKVAKQLMNQALIGFCYVICMGDNCDYHFYEIDCDNLGLIKCILQNILQNKRGRFACFVVLPPGDRQSREDRQRRG